MKISTLAAAALIGGSIGFTAPNAEAFPLGNQQIDVEQTATVTEVGFRKYKKAVQETSAQTQISRRPSPSAPF